MALKGILDTRFYFSYHSPENEKVATWSKKVVQRLLRGELELASSTITIAELYNTMGRVVGRDVVKLRIASAKASNIKFIPVTEEIAQLAGKITLNTPGVPLADAIIAATAFIYAEALVITDDEHFKLIKKLKVRWVREI
jgi:predicted nucleic acid-binding protein